MQDEKKVYGFTLSLYEYIETIPTLWAAVKGTPDAIPTETLADPHQNSSLITPSIWPRTTQ